MMVNLIETTPEAVSQQLDISHNHEAGLIPMSTQTMMRALSARIAELEAERDEAMRQGLYLAKYLHQKHYIEVTNWEPLDDPAGVISQIDNMIAGMSARIAELESRLTEIKGENT